MKASVASVCALLLVVCIGAHVGNGIETREAETTLATVAVKGKAKYIVSHKRADKASVAERKSKKLLFEARRKRELARERQKKAEQRTKIMMCGVQLFAHGGTRICVPKCAYNLGKKYRPRMWKRIKRLFPRCSSSEMPCVPRKYLSFPKFPFGKRRMSSCPKNCFEKSRKPKAICLARSLKGIKLGGLSNTKIPFCPRCVDMCLPSYTKARLKFPVLGGFRVKIPTCSNGTCKKRRVEHTVCVPKAFRLLRRFRHLRKVFKTCGSCQRLCKSPYIKFPKIHKHFHPPNCKSSCKHSKKTTPCLPRELRHVRHAKSAGIMRLLRVCKPCEKPCLPTKVWQLLPKGLRNVIKVPKCPSNCKKLKSIKRKLCVPPYLKTGVVPHKHKSRVPTCKGCERACMPPYVRIKFASKHAMVFFPPCKQRCKKYRGKDSHKRAAVCLPKLLHGMKLHGTGIPPGVKHCPKCVDFCLPKGRVGLHLPKWVYPPVCPKADCGGNTKHKFCIAPWLRYVKHMLPVIKELNIPPCKPCERMCIPSYVQVPQLPFDLHELLPRCKPCARMHPTPAVCLPLALAATKGIFRGNFKPLLKSCPKCVEPCLPKGLRPFVKKKFIRFATCKEKPCRGAFKKKRSVRHALCIPKHLRYVFQKIKPLAELHLPQCSTCTNLCMPSYLRLPKGTLPAGVHLAPTCFEHQCLGAGIKQALCMPKELAGVKFDGGEKLIPCPACHEACMPRLARGDIRLPRVIHFETCPPDRCEHMKYAVCLPTKFKKVKFHGRALMSTCGYCTAPCMPHHVQMKLPFNMQVETCPFKNCKITRYTECLPPELLTVRSPALRQLGLRACTRCERPCLKKKTPKLPFKIKFPRCSLPKDKRKVAKHKHQNKSSGQRKISTKTQFTRGKAMRQQTRKKLKRSLRRFRRKENRRLHQKQRRREQRAAHRRNHRQRRQLRRHERKKFRQRSKRSSLGAAVHSHLTGRGGKRRKRGRKKTKSGKRSGSHPQRRQDSSHSRKRSSKQKRNSRKPNTKKYGLLAKRSSKGGGRQEKVTNKNAKKVNKKRAKSSKRSKKKKIMPKQTFRPKYDSASTKDKKADRGASGKDKTCRSGKKGSQKCTGYETNNMNYPPQVLKALSGAGYMVGETTTTSNNVNGAMSQSQLMSAFSGAINKPSGPQIFRSGTTVGV